MFHVLLSVIALLLGSAVPLFFLFSMYNFRGVRAELFRVDGDCKAIGQPILSLVDGSCVLTGKVLFTSGEQVASVATLKGDCEKYGWLFRVDRNIPCTWTGTNDIDRIHSWWYVSFNWWPGEGPVAVFMLFLWSAWWMVISAAASLWAGFLFLTIFGPRDLIVWIWNTMLYSPYWLWIDSILAVLVVGLVVYWYGYRTRVHSTTPISKEVVVEEIASTSTRKSPPSMNKLPDKLNLDGGSILFTRQGRPLNQEDQQ